MSRKAPEINPKSAETVTFRGFVFLTKINQLQTVEGKTIDLRSQSTEVLSMLAARPGEIVPKDALMQAVWPDTFVTDDSLTQCIADIRRALGDGEHVIVETVPKKGYRLNADLPEAADPHAAADAEQAKTGFSQRGFILVAILLIAAVIGAYYSTRMWSPARVHPSDIPRIAVLPFDDFSSGEDKGYLSDAVAEGIITELARSKTYAVVARNSSFRYRDQPVDARQIGEELGVDYLLEGSQQKIGDRLKVTAQLVNASDGSHLWANTYNRQIGDLFVVQEEIVRTLADRVGQRILRAWPESDNARVSALHYYLMGLAEIQKDFSAAGMARQRQFNLKAVEADPNAQYGYIGLAHSYAFDAMFGWNLQEHSRKEALKLGAEAADKAVLLAPDDAESHWARARVHAEALENELAIARYDRAIELNPSNSEILVASTDLLVPIGRTDEAMDRIRQAMGIDPFYPDWFNWQMAWVLYDRHDCEGALAALRKMADIPTGAYKRLAMIYACLGMEREAKETLAVFLKDTPGASISRERRDWAGSYTSPAFERGLRDLRFAGMPE